MNSTYTVGQQVWDFATGQWAQIVEIIPDDDAPEPRNFYRLDAVPPTAEYPTAVRTQYEIGSDPDSEHGIIYGAATTVALDADRLAVKNPKQKTIRAIGYQVEYSYIGFTYRLSKTAEGWVAHPLPGQHRAASKPKHRNAAIECYRNDYNEE